MIARQKLKPAVRAALAAAGKLEAFLARESALMTGGRPKAAIKRLLAEEFPEFREAAGEVYAQTTGAGPARQESPTMEATPPPDIIEDEEYDRIQGEVRRTTDWVAAVRFCYDFMDIENVDPALAPSTGALSMLRHLQSNPSAKNEFYKTTMPKLLPTKQQLSDEEDDVGISDLQVLCDRVAEAARKAKETACATSPSS